MDGDGADKYLFATRMIDDLHAWSWWWWLIQLNRTEYTNWLSMVQQTYRDIFDILCWVYRQIMYKDMQEHPRLDCAASLPIYNESESTYSANQRTKMCIINIFIVLLHVRTKTKKRTQLELLSNRAMRWAMFTCVHLYIHCAIIGQEI